MAGENNIDDKRSQADKERSERRVTERAQREDRRTKEQAQRDERRAKEAAGRERSKGQTPKATAEKRALREEAKKYDIDTKGMSSKEVKETVAAAKEVENDMMKFIENSLSKFSAPKNGGDLTPSRTPATTTNRSTEDRPPLLFPPPAQTGGGNKRSDSIPPPPSSGIYILGSVDGVLTWLQTDNC
jgi:hypothetical protein